MTLTTIVNDNNDSRTDEEVMAEVMQLLETRVSIETGFVADEDGTFTHQIMQLRCGEFVTTSQPEPLAHPLRAATAAELGAVVN